MSISKVLFVIGGSVFLVLGVIGIVIPVLPTTPFLLVASFCFLKGSDRLYRWIMANKHFGPRINRIRYQGLTKKEKIGIYVLVFAMLLPVIILTHSLHLRIFLIVLLVVKAVVFLRIKTAPARVVGEANAE
jgi:uncharacterized membrane protein YbaN (DUF454 family)